MCFTWILSALFILFFFRCSLLCFVQLKCRHIVRSQCVLQRQSICTHTMSRQRREKNEIICIVAVVVGVVVVVGRTVCIVFIRFKKKIFYFFRSFFVVVLRSLVLMPNAECILCVCVSVCTSLFCFRNEQIRWMSWLPHRQHHCCRWFRKICGSDDVQVETKIPGAHGSEGDRYMQSCVLFKVEQERKKWTNEEKTNRWRESESERAKPNRHACFNQAP